MEEIFEDVLALDDRGAADSGVIDRMLYIDTKVNLADLYLAKAIEQVWLVPWKLGVLSWIRDLLSL